MIGPLHTVGISGLSNIKFTDINLSPDDVSAGIMPFLPFIKLFVTPKIFAILGPVTSASRIHTLYPDLLSSEANIAVIEDFPTPHFTTMISLIRCIILILYFYNKNKA